MDKKEARLDGPVPPEVLNTIIMIAEQMAPKYLFPGRDVDDMKQQAIMIGLQALNKWDDSRPLENFMRVHIKRRLLNYRRDNYVRCEKTTDPARAAKLADYNRRRQNIMMPLDVSEVEHIIVSYSSAHEDVSYDELIKLIKSRVPARLRSDFLRMLDGVHVREASKDKIREIIAAVLEEYHGKE